MLGWKVGGGGESFGSRKASVCQWKHNRAGIVAFRAFRQVHVVVNVSDIKSGDRPAMESQVQTDERVR